MSTCLYICWCNVPQKHLSTTHGSGAVPCHTLLCPTLVIYLYLVQARTGAMEEFESIISDSASSMKADTPLLTAADKSAWWRKRLALDQRMAGLLQHLDDDWLGPWK